MDKISKYKIILKYTLLFALLLPFIQGTQLYLLFDLWRPILLIMPVVMGSITGFLVGFYRYRVILNIQKLEYAKSHLQNQVDMQTKELQEKNLQLEKTLLLDPLTGLGNRLKLKKFLTSEISRIGDEYKYLSFFMIDIDYFKGYNDYYGHIRGDSVLKSLGSYFQDKMNQNKYKIIRFGGEEFTAIIPNCDEHLAKDLAQEFVDGIRNLKITHEKSQVNDYVTISLGIYTTSDRDLTVDCDCLKKADIALYDAKESGRDRFRAYKS